MRTEYSSNTENYFWIDRTLDIIKKKKKKKSIHSIERCFQTSKLYCCSP